MGGSSATGKEAARSANWRRMRMVKIFISETLERFFGLGCEMSWSRDLFQGREITFYSVRSGSQLCGPPFSVVTAPYWPKESIANLWDWTLSVPDIRFYTNLSPANTMAYPGVFSPRSEPKVNVRIFCLGMQSLLIAITICCSRLGQGVPLLRVFIVVWVDA